LLDIGKECDLVVALVQKLRQLGDGWILKDFDRRNFPLKASVILAYHPNRRQRISTQVKKAVVHAYFFQLQQFALQICQLLFCRRPRGDKRLGKKRTFAFWLRKRVAIELGIRGQREFLHPQKDGRDHVIRQTGFEDQNDRARTQPVAARVVGDQ